MYTLYHMTEPDQFYTVADPWQIARDPSNSPRPTLRAPFASPPMLPYYLLMELPESDSLSFLLMQPFTPRDRPNMVSFMVAKSGPLEEYGRIIDFSLPAESQIDGPGQVGNFINQNPVISAEFTLLGQTGSRVIQGNMLVIPIEDSLLYVQPVYISADDEGNAGGIPEFKRVVVSFDGQIEMRDTLDEALEAIFGESSGGVGDGSTEPPTGTVDEQVAELLLRAADAFEEAELALRRGDIVAWAEKIDEAQQAVEEAARLVAGELTGADA
jgi:uncharacterized membrane protein (UPF0182 family)